MSRSKNRQSHRKVERAAKKLDDRRRVAMKVLRKLGKPPRLARVDVINVHGRNYRVNVIVRDYADLSGLLCARLLIAHSYFVTECAPNLEIEADPPIVRKY